MSPLRRRLLCTVAISLALGFGAADVAVFGAGPIAKAQAANPCSPCRAAPAGGATDCFVPRLQEAQANPCAAKNPCTAASPADPCAARKPCAAAANPCAARAPCGANPCAVKNPCSATANPCAAKNPCAAANPFAVKNPCSAAANPCNPCAAVEAPDVTPEELRAIYECLQGYMRTAYGGDWLDGAEFAEVSTPAELRVAYSDSGLEESKSFLDWKNFALHPYPSATHGNRFVVNHANDVAEEPYGRYEEIGAMPEGGIIAKPSFTIAANGQAQLGPLFLMEKMGRGWDSESRDWRYTMVLPDGTVTGRTQGPKAEAVAFCAGCHAAVADDRDSLFFIPEDVRVR